MSCLSTTGATAIQKAVEFAEDSQTAGWDALAAHDARPGDVVVGIASSGTTPWVLHALQACRQHNIVTAAIVCNANSPSMLFNPPAKPDAPEPSWLMSFLLMLSRIVEAAVDYPIVVVVGPEFVTGSTRMKAGTAQKMVLNMISTACMIHLGRVKGNRYVLCTVQCEISTMRTSSDQCSLLYAAEWLICNQLTTS
jgi:N-acetylmuramic acid 6-phosphate etherase